MLTYLLLLYSNLFSNTIFCDYVGAGIMRCENQYYVVRDSCTVPCNYVYILTRDSNVACYLYDEYIIYSGIIFVKDDKFSNACGCNNQCGCSEQVKKVIEYRWVWDLSLRRLEIEN